MTENTHDIEVWKVRTYSKKKKTHNDRGIFKGYWNQLEDFPMATFRIIWARK